MTCVADMDTMLEETGLRTVPRVVRTTDASGNFLLQHVPAGPQIVFVVPTLGLFGRRTTLLNYNETLEKKKVSGCVGAKPEESRE